MTNRLHTTSLNLGNYDTLVAEAMMAFSQDIVYAIQVVESARSISAKKRKVLKRNQTKV